MMCTWCNIDTVWTDLHDVYMEDACRGSTHLSGNVCYCKPLSGDTSGPLQVMFPVSIALLLVMWTCSLENVFGHKCLEEML